MTSYITKRSRRIPNAWHFGFAFNFVFTAQWFRLGGSVAHHLTRRYVSEYLCLIKLANNELVLVRFLTVSLYNAIVHPCRVLRRIYLLE